MCGIYGILTNQANTNLFKLIIESLIQLQNRGYDSSGIALLDSNNNDYIIHKYASTNTNSSIEKLLSLNLNLNFDNISIGIGHNRWATHGAKNDINAHPHISNDKKFVLVHNGIIENYIELKNLLSKNGYTFYSQTDTEIIVNLISYYYNEGKDTFDAINKTINELHGTYGLIIINIDEPDVLYCVRNGSPLLIGNTDEYCIITSEQSGFCNMVNNYITLNNDDICTISKREENNIFKIDISTNSEYIHKKVNLGNYDLTPDPYKHWTLKEIYEKPNTIFNSINRGGRIKNKSEVKLGGLEEHIDILKNINNIILLGCGTSYHAALYGMNFLKNICNFNTVQKKNTDDDLYNRFVPRIKNNFPNSSFL
jgi:glucosamine--fructose-6-phosphate aminotransferase (isomerizing)